MQVLIKTRPYLMFFGWLLRTWNNYHSFIAMCHLGMSLDGRLFQTSQRVMQLTYIFGFFHIVGCAIASTELMIFPLASKE